MEDKRIERILNVVCGAAQPVTVDYVRHHAGIGWQTAKALLLGLVIQGKIAGQQTSGGWIFWNPRRSSPGPAQLEASTSRTRARAAAFGGGGYPNEK